MKLSYKTMSKYIFILIWISSKEWIEIIISLDIIDLSWDNMYKTMI